MESVIAEKGVMDAIADIETRRQVTERDAGFAMSRSSALHRLQELLDHENEALRLRGPDSGHPANIEVVTTEIARVRALSPAVAHGGPAGRSAFPAQRKATWQDASPGLVRSRGRRTMGRAGGR